MRHSCISDESWSGLKFGSPTKLYVPIGSSGGLTREIACDLTLGSVQALKKTVRQSVGSSRIALMVAGEYDVGVMVF